jgi:phage terminase small subunit
MPDLTEQQRNFVYHYTSTPGCIGNGAASVREAGYGAKHPAEIARQLLEKPHVKAALDAANKQAVSGRLFAKAVALLERVIEDEDVSMKVRVDAAKVVLARADGLLAPGAAVSPAFGHHAKIEQSDEEAEMSRKVVMDFLSRVTPQPASDGDGGAVAGRSDDLAELLELAAGPARGAAEGEPDTD